jgi:hypothetical protein
MDKYNNLNTCNVLYNRPSCLDKTYASENINENNRLLYKLKLLQLSPAFLRNGAYEYFKTAVDECIDGNVSELLCLSIALMGGAYKEQLNYLGLFPIKEVTGKSSVCRCYIQNINKRTFNIGTNIIDTIQTKNSENMGNQIFYHLTDAARELCAEKLSLLGEHPLKKNIQLKDLSLTHDHNLEHAAGVIDLYAYILGNPYYPAQFDFSYEHICNISDETYFVADGLVTTMYKNETDSVFKATDYVEVDTGSQGSEIIKEKLINYIHFFEKSTHLFPLTSLTFLYHPSGICSGVTSKKSLTGEKKPSPLESMAFLYLGKMFENIKLSVDDIIKIIKEGNTGNKNVGCSDKSDKASSYNHLIDSLSATEYRELFSDNTDWLLDILIRISNMGYGKNLLCSLYKKCLYEYANERSIDNAGTADTFGEQAKEEINDTKETKSTKETYGTVHTYENEGTSKPDNTDNTNDTFDTSEELPVKNDSISNSYQEKYVRNLRKYLRRRNLIFEKAVDFIRTDDPGSYEKFVSLCLNGLSVSCVFGGDLYATFLSAHPNMTGLYEFLRKWIIKKAFYFNISDTPGLDASKAYLPAAILGNAGNTFVLKNILTFREVSGSIHTFAIEDISTDYAARIRIEKAISTDSLRNSKIRLFIITDGYEDAYLLLSSFCYIENKGCVTSKLDNLFVTHRPMETVTDDYSPTFIPREYLMRHLYEGTGFEEESKITHNTTDTGAVNICKSERLCLHPFVFTDTSFLRKCITMYNAASSKNVFRIFFKDKLSKVSGCPDIKFI